MSSGADIAMRSGLLAASEKVDRKGAYDMKSLGKLLEALRSLPSSLPSPQRGVSRDVQKADKTDFTVSQVAANGTKMTIRVEEDRLAPQALLPRQHRSPDANLESSVPVPAASPTS
jgi:hypothetical protein